MYSVGLTSGIGCGKTLIAKVFSTFGIPVFNSDQQAKELYKDSVFLQQIVHTFGNTIIENGKFIPQRLADIVFNNSQALKTLNALIHPKVLERYKLWQSQQTSPYTILESAIIFESNWQNHFNKIINITSPLEIVIERVKLRDKISEEQILQRINNQLPVEEKEKLSDYNIFHDNKTMLLPQIIEIHNDILEKSKKIE
ncbi:MAG: dephospho-CoA kinase [Bacteroidales bacterium]|nr:dephospho-CoA kinase [Bacteroidales bacterium]MBQ5891402.1 dephospho-CoA kinase [Bacteroidales bacterium]